MHITGYESEQSILKEIGARIKAIRVSANLTQAQLAEKCGISISTETRIENGEDTKFSNILKILSVLDMIENIDLFIPEEQQDYKAIYENRQKKKRVRKSHPKPKTSWTWGDDI